MIDLFLKQWNRFFPNSPTLYIYCVIVSVLAVIATYIFTGESKEKQKKRENDEAKELGLQARYKLAKQKVVEEQLTPEQQLEEKRSESESLAAIYKLLQDRKDMFPDATMDDIRSQFGLYKCTK